MAVDPDYWRVYNSGYDLHTEDPIPDGCRPWDRTPDGCYPWDNTSTGGEYAEFPLATDM